MEFKVWQEPGFEQGFLCTMIIMHTVIVVFVHF